MSQNDKRVDCGNDQHSNLEEKPYHVGYGRPPIHSQFKNGQSGNPKGRRKGQVSLDRILVDLLQKPIQVREGGQARAMPALKAAIRVLLNKALQGDTRSLSKLLDIAAKSGLLSSPAAVAAASPHVDSDQAKKKLMQLLDRAAAHQNRITQPAKGLQ